MTDEAPSRGEFELLRQIVAGNQARLEAIDATGTRGVGVVQAQLVDVIRDVADLKAEVGSRAAEVGLRFDTMKADVDRQFAGHAEVHDQERRDRVSGRRWLVTTGIAGMAGMAAVIGLLVDILRHVH